MATEEEQQQEAAILEESSTEDKWPGWPGDCVFRLIVPVAKVGSIIGRKGELIKKMCDETGARIRVLDGPIGNPDRVVLISGKEDPLLPLSPAMDAALRVFRRVSALSDDTPSAAFSSIRLLVASTQAINLIGKQGSLIKSIQESTGSSVRVLSTDDAPNYYASPDERLVELQGEASKVLNALEAVVSHLRKFLVDHTVLPLFEKPYSAPAAAVPAAPAAVQERQQVDVWANNPAAMAFNNHTGLNLGFGLGPGKREPPQPQLYFDREAQLDSQMGQSGISLYGQDPTLSGIRPAGLGRSAGVPIVTQIVQTMQIPLAYAEDIIGIEGSNIAYIRRTSGAILTVQESRGLPDEITVEIKGTGTQVQMAQQLIQEVLNNHHNKEQASNAGYGRIEAGLRSSYPQMNAPPPTYAPPQTLLPPQPPYGGGYGSAGVSGGSGSGSGNFTTFRL